MIVACKVQNGIDLGGVTANGPKLPEEGRPPQSTTGGYVLTQVDDAVWNTWYGRNRDSGVVQNKFIFAAATMDEVRGMCWANKRTAAPQQAPAEASMLGKRLT